MKKENRLEEIMEEIEQKAQKLGAYTLKRLNEETGKAMDVAYEDFGIYQQRIISDIFIDAVEQFYSAYTPVEYQRTYGLFDVLNIEPNIDDRGMVITGTKGYGDLFDSTKMHKDRKGNDLFEKVFMHGWHGGAESINSQAATIWGSHPSPGTPHYRTHGWVKHPKSTVKQWHRYGSWGMQAKQTKSPYKYFREHMMALERREMINEFKKITQEHNDRAVARVQKEAAEYAAGLFR